MAFEPSLAPRQDFNAGPRTRHVEAANHSSNVAITGGLLSMETMNPWTRTVKGIPFLLYGNATTW